MGNTRKRATNHQLLVPIGAKRSYLERERDQWWIISEVAKGRTYEDIANELHEKTGVELTRQTIANDVEAILVEWKRQNYENIDAYIAKELARIENIEQIVINSFENSKNPSPHDYAALMKRGMTPEEIDEMFESRKMGGDPRFLQVLLNLQRQRMKLLGIEKGNDVAQVSVVNYNFGDMDIHDLTKIADGLQDNKFKQEIDDQ